MAQSCLSISDGSEDFLLGSNGLQLVMVSMVVSAKVPQSALVPPDLVMAEMKEVGVMLEKATCHHSLQHQHDDQHDE